MPQVSRENHQVIGEKCHQNEDQQLVKETSLPSFKMPYCGSLTDDEEKGLKD